MTPHFIVLVSSVEKCEDVHWIYLELLKDENIIPESDSSNIDLICDNGSIEYYI